MNTIKVYTINELSEDVRNKVLERESDINTQFGDWYEFVMTDFISLAKFYGYYLQERDINFSGFCSQGDGACFVTKINVADWIKAHKSIKGIKEYAPKDKTLHTIFKDTQESIKALPKYKWYEEEVGLYRNDTHYSHKYTVSSELINEEEGTPYQIEKIVLGECRSLMDWLYKSLESEYEHLSSKESVLETLECNEYQYTESGIMV